MSADGPEKKKEASFDVVWMHSPTEDGAGARVVRARPGRIEAGEVRPMAEGRPMTPGGEVVRLERRAGAEPLFDVRVECTVPGTANTEATPPGSTASSQGGPAQVATREYRENWELTFGTGRSALN